MLSKKTTTYLCLFMLLLSACKGTDSRFNLNFEILDSAGLPACWHFSDESSGAAYTFESDKKITRSGSVSLHISQPDNVKGVAYAYMNMAVPEGPITVDLSGYIKCSNIENGNVGLWARIKDKGDNPVASDYMQDRAIDGTRNWNLYSLKLEGNAYKSSTLTIGVILNGTGDAWFDNLKVQVNGKPLQKTDFELDDIQEKTVPDTLQLALREKVQSPVGIQQLYDLGVLWGFFKYHHSDVAARNSNWDEELFTVTGNLMSCRSRKAGDTLLARWADSLLCIPSCNMDVENVSYANWLQQVFAGTHLSAPLVKRLVTYGIRATCLHQRYYVSLEPGTGKPIFTNEISYPAPYPATMVRLLALFRYWNMVQYYYPYRYLMGNAWFTMLKTSIPEFINAQNKQEYTFACLHLISGLEDSHADLWNNSVLEAAKGNNTVPFETRFIESKLIITRLDSVFQNNPDFHPGDRIDSLDGISVDALVHRFLPLTPGSNMGARLRNLESGKGFLLRSDKSSMDISLQNKTGKRRVKCSLINTSTVKRSFSQNVQYEAFKLINPQTGYINPSKLKGTDISIIKKQFSNTKVIIIDLRCYPSTVLFTETGDWFKGVRFPYVSIARANTSLPGFFNFQKGAEDSRLISDTYKGKLIILVDSYTQSQAEYTTMFFQSAPGAVVIGSQTAGADGNISYIKLPGNVNTAISGLGIYYPDGSPTQRVGVKIDVSVTPTIAGVRAGKDEVLEKALSMVNR